MVCTKFFMPESIGMQAWELVISYHPLFARPSSRGDKCDAQTN